MPLIRSVMRRLQLFRQADAETDRWAPQARFNTLLETARAVADQNPYALSTFISMILRPLQSRYLLGVSEVGRDPYPTISSHGFFGELVRRRLYGPGGSFRGTKLDGNSFTLVLGRDAVLPWPWNAGSNLSPLAHIGSSKCPSGVTERQVSEATWRQDGNHRIELWLPWRIGFVNGGNHSIAAGILAGEGEIIPDSVYDMSFLLDEVQCDGRYYVASVGKSPLREAVHDPHIAAVYEIGRLVRARFPLQSAVACAATDCY